MELAQVLPLDASRQPLLQPDEVTYRLQAEIDLYDRDAKTNRKHGTAVLTSHRLGWIDGSRTDCIQWQLSQVVRTEVEEGGFFAGSPKIIVHLSALSAASASQSYPRLPAGAVRTPVGHIKLSFKSGGRDPFAEDLKKACSRQAWVVQEADTQISAAKRGRSEAPVGPAAGGGAPGPALVPEPRRFGIAGVLETEAARAEAGRALANTAFSDLEELVKHGKRVAELAEKYSRELRTKAAGGSASPAAATPTGTDAPGAASGVDAESEAAGSLLAGLGIVAPVTREMAGSLYITELARQLASFIGPRLQRLGGMAPLTDVYVAYNRARGTDPVSPDDFLEAVRLYGSSSGAGSAAAGSAGGPSHAGTAGPRLAVGLHLETLPGGVKVLQLDSFSPVELRRRLLALLASQKPGQAAYPYLTAYSVASSLQMPLAIAEHHLAAAEAAAVLCRDDSINGLRFYENVFLSQQAASGAA